MANNMFDIVRCILIKHVDSGVDTLSFYAVYHYADRWSYFNHV